MKNSVAEPSRSAAVRAQVETQRRRSLLHSFAAFGMLAIGVAILAFAMTSDNAANRDFVSYWAAGHQLAHRANPYDGPAILRIEKSAGFLDNRPFFMRNPPCAFFLALPLGFVGGKAGAVLWSLALVAALMWAVRLMWIMNGKPPDRLHLISYVFPPALACLLAGQIGIFILLGVVLFLRLNETSPYLAGAALLLCGLKPHLFLPFAAVLLASSAARRSYKVLTGAVAALAASLALSFALDSRCWSHYAKMAAAAKLQDEFIPTVSLFFRLAIDRHAVWLQFVPAIFGSVWALWYFWHNRERWSWTDQGSLLLIVSVMVAPYAWFTDETVLLPAILAALYRASDAGRSLLPFGFVAGAALVEVLAGLEPNSGFYLWTAPAWLLWYLWAIRSAGRTAESGRAE